jgi:hypothetical protein
VWCVFRGDYSDRELAAVFSSEAKANAYAEPLGLMGDIQGIDVDAAPVAPPGKRSWSVTLDIDSGDVVQAHKSDEPPWEKLTPNAFGVCVLGLDGGRIVVESWATGEAHATKIAGEKRAHWLAG